MSAVMEAQEPSAKYLSALQPPLVQHFELMATAPGGVAKLRELILALAVQGKLVPQDPSNEPASALLKKIQAEKDLMVAEGKRKIDKPMADISEDEEPFSLPIGWQWTQLGHIATQVTDGTHHTPKYLPSGVAFISVKDINGNTVSFADCKFISIEEHRQINTRCNPEKGDLLLCRIGTLGRPTLVDTDRPFSLFVSVGLLKLPKSCNVSSYMHLVMRSPLLVAQYDAIKAGGSHTNKLNLGDIPRLLIPVPPLVEQSRIVTRVEEFMRLCDALEAKGQLEAEQHTQLVQTLLGALTASTTPDELADNWQRVATHFDILLDRPEAIDALEQTILQLAVRGLLVPQDPKDEPAIGLLQSIRIKKKHLVAKSNTKQGESFSEINEAEQPFELPRGWEWVRMGDLIEGGSGTTPLRARTDYFAAGTEMWVKTTDLNNGVVTSCEELITKSAVVENRLKYFPMGTVCVAMYGGAGTIGKSGVLGVASTINQSVFALPPTEGIDSDFLHTYVISVRSKWMSFAAGLRKDPNINGQIIKRMVMPLPPLAEQRRIVARVESLRRLCAELRRCLAASQTTQAQLAEALIDEVALACG